MLTCIIATVLSICGSVVHNVNVRSEINEPLPMVLDQGDYILDDWNLHILYGNSVEDIPLGVYPEHEQPYDYTERYWGEILEAINQNWFTEDEKRTAACVVWYESHGNKYAVSHTYEGIGVWQINPLFWYGFTLPNGYVNPPLFDTNTYTVRHDIFHATRLAKEIQLRSGWDAWSAYDYELCKNFDISYFVSGVSQ